MPEPLQPDDLPPIQESASDAATEVFFNDALTRIRRIMLVIGVVATVVTWGIYGWRIGLGVFLGCLLAWANFIWLKQAISSVAEKVTQTGRGQSGAGTVAKFVLRYALIGIAAYVIFLSSRQSLWGFFGGLFLAVAAILCEAAYEAFMALRRGL